MSTPPTWYHARTPPPPPRPPLRRSLDARFCIVGGGLAGLATALSLAERGHSPILLEARRIGCGASGRNGGMASTGLTRPLAWLRRRCGPDIAHRMYAASREALGLMRRRIAEHAIACDPIDGVLEASWFDDAASLREDVTTLNRDFGMRLEFWPRTKLRAHYRSPRYHDGIFDPEGFHFDPLAFARGYAAAIEKLGGRIFEDSPVRRCRRRADGFEVMTDGGRVRAEEIVLCPNVYGPACHPRLARALLPVVSYVIVTEPLGERLECAIRAPYAVFDDRMATGYYRPLEGGRLLWGGRVALFERRRGIAELMRRDLAEVYPQLADVPIAHAWSGRMGFARHKMPVIGRIAPGLWVATGFGGHGLNTTSMAGELLARGMLEKDRAWEPFAAFGLPWVADGLGRLVAQAYYWAYGLRDRISSSWMGIRGGLAKSKTK